MDLWRLISALLGENRTRYRTGGALLAVEGILASLTIVLAAWAIAQVTTGTSTGFGLASSVGLGLVLLLIGRFALARASKFLVFEAGSLASLKLRTKVLEKLGSVSMGALGRWSNSRLETLIVDDVRWIEMAATMILSQMAAVVAATVILILIVIGVDWKAGIAVLCCILIGGPIFLHFDRSLIRQLERRQTDLSDAQRAISDYLTGLSVLCSYGQTGRSKTRVGQAIEQLRTSQKASVVPLTFASHCGRFVVEGAFVVAVVAVLSASGAAESPTAAIVVLLATLAICQNTLTLLLNLLPQYRLGEVACASARLLLDEPNLGGTAVAARKDNDIEFDAVTFGYDPHSVVLRDVGFAAPQGTMTAIVGPSGAGKSTIFNLLVRNWDVNSGAIKLGSVDLRQADPRWLTSQISLVPQDVHLFAGTVLQNIAIGNPKADRCAVERAARMARAHDFIMRLPHGYDSSVGVAGQTLSGGERQRIAIARAILKDAPIVLLDEATASLDPENERDIQQALMALASNKTVIVIAHRLSTIVEADQILVLDAGGIIQRGRHDELLTQRGLYQSMWAARQSARGWSLLPAGEDREVCS